MNKNRFEAFSDGVFAIVITLLVLDLKIPDVNGISNQQLQTLIKAALPSLVTFVFTFLVVGIFWVAHHRIMMLASIVDTTMIWMNIVYLLFVTTIPFPAGIMARHPLLPSAIQFYTLVLLLVGSMHFIFLQHIFHHAQLRKPVFTREIYRAAWKISLFGPCCYFISAVCSFINPYVSICFIIVPILFYIFFAGRQSIDKPVSLAHSPGQ